MMHAGTQTNSLMNHLMSGAKVPTPEVGMGATVLCWTDRHAGTIISVTDKEIVVQIDKATRSDGNQMSDCQSYTYERDESASERHGYKRSPSLK